MFNKEIVVDIETVPIYSKNDVTDYRGKYSPHPLKEKIVCLSVLFMDDGNVYSFCGDNEAEILSNFWESVCDNTNIWGFNVEGFDMTYIRTRSLVNNIKIKSYRVYEIRNILYGNTHILRGRLQEFAQELNINVTADNNGSTVYDNYVAKNFSKIKEHCEEDVRIVYEIYKKMKECDFIL